MLNSLPERSLLWVRRVLGPNTQISAAHPLLGGTSSALHRLDVHQGRREYAVVLRRFVNVEWLALEPDLARHEADCLLVAARSGLPVPELIAYDETGEDCGVPAVLMSHLPGSIVLQPQDQHTWLGRMAEALVAVHQVTAPDLPWRYYPYNDVFALELPGWSQYSDHWKQALHLLQGDRPEARLTFIHRDYHPTNLLWQDGKISGVVDWVNACLGPPGIDLGHYRLNLAQLYGVEAADTFLEAYRAASEIRDQSQPFWDLLSLIEILPGPPTMYPGWTDHGFPQISPREIARRLDRYLLSILMSI